MKLVYRGKTKDVYEAGPDSFKLVFSDRVTKNDAGEIDPGGNAVADTTASGQGKACLMMSAAIFEKLQQKQIARTHMISYDVAELTMVVRKASLFSPGLEWIARWVCTGSFFRRYGMVPGISDGLHFSAPVFEITLKNDAASDPLIVPSAIVALGIVKEEIMEKLLVANEKTMHAIHKIFSAKGLELWDIKIEWGLDQSGVPILIDEISPGSCRAFKKGTKERVSGLALAEYFQI